MVRSRLALPSLVLALAPLARAQSVVWSDSFENGFADWAGGTILRLHGVLAAGNSGQYPSPGQPAVSIAGSLPFAGGMRTYQVWYRNAGSYCTSSTFSLTNGLQISWTP